jgi:hypothetical protein
MYQAFVSQPSLPAVSGVTSSAQQWMVGEAAKVLVNLTERTGSLQGLILRENCLVDLPSWKKA